MFSVFSKQINSKTAILWEGMKEWYFLKKMLDLESEKENKRSAFLFLMRIQVEKAIERFSKRKTVEVFKLDK